MRILLKEVKTLVLRGDVLDQAVAVIIGGAFDRKGSVLSETLDVGRADVHGRTFPDRLQSFKNGDVLCRIGRC